jgi:hypothetical protein
LQLINNNNNNNIYEEERLVLFNWDLGVLAYYYNGPGSSATPPQEAGDTCKHMNAERLTKGKGL